MNKDTFRGIVIGVILALALGWFVLYNINLGRRVTGIESYRPYLNWLVQQLESQKQTQKQQVSVPVQVQPQQEIKK